MDSVDCSEAEWWEWLAAKVLENLNNFVHCIDSCTMNYPPRQLFRKLRSILNMKWRIQVCGRRNLGGSDAWYICTKTTVSILLLYCRERNLCLHICANNFRLPLHNLFRLSRVLMNIECNNFDTLFCYATGQTCSSVSYIETLLVCMSPWARSFGWRDLLNSLSKMLRTPLVIEWWWIDVFYPINFSWPCVNHDGKKEFSQEDQANVKKTSAIIIFTWTWVEIHKRRSNFKVKCLCSWLAVSYRRISKVRTYGFRSITWRQQCYSSSIIVRNIVVIVDGIWLDSRKL